MKFWLIWFIGLAVSINALANPRDLQGKLKRIEQSIAEAKGNLSSARDVEFLTELYLTLAELLIEKSRVQLTLKMEKNPNTPPEEMDFTAERQPKLEAIEIYKQVLARFPKDHRTDKVLFFTAHEYKELVQADEAIKYYKRIVSEFPQSSFWDEAQLNIADFYFQKKDFDFSLEQYKRVTARGSSKGVSTAWYKIGWCYINKAKWLDAMNAFEKALDGFTQAADSLKPSDLRNADMREEALIASVWPFSELKIEELKRDERFRNPIAYYRKMAPDRFIYSRTMARLGRRLVVKKRFQEGAQAYLEAFRSSGDAMAKLDFLESYYQGFKDAKQSYYPEGLSQEIVETLEKARVIEAFNSTPKSNSKSRVAKYESLMRDIATSIQQVAQSTQRMETYRAAARAYEDYLFVYPRTKFAGAMKFNLAESLYKAGEKIESAKIYISLAQNEKNSDKASTLRMSGLQGLAEQLADPSTLNALDKFVGRAMYRREAVAYMRANPRERANEELFFNLAKVSFDERDFKTTISDLEKFIRNYPGSPRLEQAGLLLLDCYYQQDKLKDLIAAGDRLMKDTRFSPQSRAKFQSLLQDAQLKRMRSIAGDMGSKGYADKMLAMAQSKENSGMAEPGLFDAFVALRAAGDPKVFSVGESYSARFQTHERAKSVLANLIQMAITATDYARAATYLETYFHRYGSDPQARGFAEQAIVLYRNIGHYQEAAQMAKRLGDTSRALSLLAEGGLWSELANEASRAGQGISEYYSGLALLRKGNSKAALQLFRHLAQGGQVSDKQALAHALFINASATAQTSNSAKAGQTLTPQLLSERVAVIETVDRLVQSIIATGEGKWVVAGLALLASTQSQMADFLSRANAPAGVNSTQFKSMMAKQAATYRENAKAVLSKCVQVANDSEVMSKFNGACLKGDMPSDVADSWAGYPRSQSAPADTVVRQLLTTPRSLPALQARLRSARASRDWGVADLVLERMQEVKSSGETLRDQGWVALESGQYQRALGLFQKAEKAGAADAAWGRAALYIGLGLQNRFQQLRSSGELKGRAPASQDSAHPGGTHPWLKLARSRL